MAVRRRTIQTDRNLKQAFVLLLVAGIIGFSLLLLFEYPNGISLQAGFLGTRASLLSDVNLISQFILLIGLSLGVILARRGYYRAHQYMQTTMVLFNLVLALSIMVGSFSRIVAPGLPGNLSTLFGLITTVHASIGSLAIICGIYLLLRMNHLIPKNMRIKNWKYLMRLTFGVYWIVGLLGLGVYLVWYVL